MKKAGGIAIDVVRRVAGGKRPALDRSFAGRFARRLAKKHRRNWRENGLRPRGRGDDWARQLIPEELIKAAAGDGTVSITYPELARRVQCSPRTAMYYVARLAAVDQYGRPESEQDACVRKLARTPGRGSGIRLALNLTAIAGLLKWLTTRKERRFAKSSRQLALFKEKPMEIPAEIQAQIDRLAKLAAARGTLRPASEDRAKILRSPDPIFSGRKGDLFPHTPTITEITPSESSHELLDRTAPRPRVKIANRGPGLTVRPDKAALRTDWLEIAAIDRTERDPLSETHRRRLMRHLRLACWNRGLDQARTRHVAGAIGWEAQRMRKASSRKYLLIDGIRWVMASSSAELRGATAHFLGMVKVVRGLSSGSDARPPNG